MTLAAVASDLHRALKMKPCACIWHWNKDGYCVKTQCQGCRALEAYDKHVAAGAPVIEA